MNDLRLSIRQTYAAIGMDSIRTQQQMHMPAGDLQIQQPEADMDFQTSDSAMSIDSSQAWHALGKGPNLEWSSAIYSQMKSIFLQQLAQQVDEGRRMADITTHRSAFADLARSRLFEANPVNYQVATPGYDNVDIQYTPGQVETAITPSPAQIDYTPHQAEIDVSPGKLDIYLRQRNSISIDVTRYDLYR